MPRVVLNCAPITIWERHLDGGGPPDLDAFIGNRLADAPTDLVAVFRPKASAVLRYRHMIAAAQAGSTPGLGAGETAALAAIVAPGQEPIPGYRLEVKIGEGGFGSVWRATAPDGRAVAVKLLELDGIKARAESRSVRLLCGVRHPNLIDYHEATHVDRRLAIVMELADGTVADRLAEARSAGLPGIPRDELLRYMAAAAAGLDFLNAGGPGRKPIQHRDVKPQNLLLLRGELKVADFGIARSLDHSVTSHTGSHTPAYAAPEFFKNRVTSRSDQYSLAVTYCELRGDRLPFAGTREGVVRGHLSEEPDLSMLPAAERPIVRRALAKTPRHRWPSCAAFVDALRDGVNPDAVRRELLADLDNVPLRRLYLAVRTPAQLRADLNTLPLQFALHFSRTILPVMLAAGGLAVAGTGLLFGDAVNRWVLLVPLCVITPAILYFLPDCWAYQEKRRELRKAVTELGPLETRPYHMLDLATIRACYLVDRDVSDLNPEGAVPPRTS